MSKLPLPPLLPFCGDWSDYIERVYEVYTDTILNSGLAVNNIPVRPRYTPVSQGKEFGFWHVTSEGEVEEERAPDLRRCERIRWLEWTISNFTQYAQVSHWNEKKGSKRDKIIWIESEQYVVVLSERRDYWLLKTAYLADKSGKIRQLTRNRDKYQRP